MTRRLFCTLAAALIAAAFPACAEAPTAVRAETLVVESKILRGNPLGDPATRRVALFVPAGVMAGSAVPVVYYLPGYGGSSEEFIAQGLRSPFAALVQRLAADGLPLVLAVVDGRNRWGGSQYLNSPAQGNYADYVAEEIVAAVEARYPAAKGRAQRVVAGHSSGAFGSLRLAMAFPKVFGAAIALAPDSDFGVTHRGVLEAASVRRTTPAQVATFTEAKNWKRPGDDILELMLGLSAAYAPVGPSAPGRIHWLYDDAGKLQPAAWQRWLDNDPLTLVQKNPHAFAPDQRLYLDGGARDEWGFNVSARKVYEILRTRPAPVTFHEPPGGHSDALPERLERGLRWVFDRPLKEAR